MITQKQTNIRSKRSFSILKLTAFAATAWLFMASGLFAENLIKNAEFATDDSGQAQDWNYTAGAPAFVSVHEEDGRNFLRISRDQPGAAAIFQNIPVNPADGALIVSVKMRAENLVPGEAGWTGARFAMEFRDASGSRTGGWPASPRLRKPTDGWQLFESREIIPPDAKHLNLQLGVWRSSGTVDFTDISIEVDEDYEIPSEVKPEVEGIVPITTGEQTAWSTRSIPPPIKIDGASLSEPDETVFLYVAPDGDDGNDGLMQAAPLATLAAALNKATPLLNRGEAVGIRLASGVYREDDLSLGRLQPKGRQTMLIIEGEQPGAVSIRASSVYDDWRAVGNGRYETAFDKNIEPSTSAWGQTEPILLRREMVFIDGEPLRQVLTEEKLIPGRFWVDDANRRLVIYPKEGIDPRQRLVEVADSEPGGRRSILDISDKPNVILRNLEFAHDNQRLHNTFAVRGTSNLLIENCRFVHNNSGGLGLNDAENVTIRNSQINHNGGLGLFGWRVRNLLIEDSETNYNNWRGNAGGYNAWSVAGIKLHWVEHIRLDNYRAVGNLAPGFWVDLWCYHIEIENSHFEDNALEAAVLLELAQHIDIGNSRFVRNAEAIRFHDANEVRVENSEFIGNAVTFMVYSSRQVLVGGAPGSQRGNMPGRYIPNANFTLENSSVKVEDRPEWQTRTEAEISSFLQFYSIGYPPFFHVANRAAEETFYPTMSVEQVEWENPMEEKPFVGPHRERLSEAEFIEALADGWQRTREWRPSLNLGKNTLPVQDTSRHEPIRHFQYLAILNPYLSLKTEDNSSFVRIEQPFLRSRQALFADLALPENARSVSARVPMRLNDLSPGEQAWQVPRWEIFATDIDGNRVGQERGVRFTNLNRWETAELTLEIPEEATGLHLRFVTHHVGCIWDIGNVELKIE